jgi:hypothetical protein
VADPYLPLKLPIGGSANDEASTRVHAIHPSGLPQPVTPGWNGSPWACYPGLRTSQLPATHAEAGTVLAHWTEHYVFDISRTSFDEYHYSHATSCRTIWLIQDAWIGRCTSVAVGQAVLMRSTEACPAWLEPLSTIQNTRRAEA